MFARQSRQLSYAKFCIVSATVFCALIVPTSAFGDMVITEAENTCIANVPYPVIEASIDPAPEVARVYFRSGDSDAFYFIEMAGGDGSYQGVLPVPSAETAQVIYYVEAISSAADAARTPEYEAKVADEDACAGKLYLGADPQIIVHSTVPGAAALPQGFLSNGVATTVSVAGTASAVAPAVVAAGGLGAGAITGIVVGGAAAGAVIVNELDEDDETAASPSDP